LAEHAILLELVAERRAAEDGIALRTQTILLLAETDIIEDDQSVFADPFDIGFPVSRLLDESVEIIPTSFFLYEEADIVAFGPEEIREMTCDEVV
jgi:hypothetical protein